jgi:hypothetical protein
MARPRQPRNHPPAASWRPTDAELGSIIENRLDEAYLLSWPGPLEIWVPVHDTGGYDRARAPLGSYDFRLDQIKGTTSLHAGNQVRIAFAAPALHPRRNLDFTFVFYDLGSRAPVDPLWKVNSLDLEKACTRIPGQRQPLWQFEASRSGLARDGAAKYQISLRELAGSNGWSVLPPQSPSPLWGGSGRGLPRVSAQPIETNAFFKRHFDAAFLEVATGDEVLMAAQPDVFGRHRLVFSKATGDWLTISIHGGIVTGSTGLIQANVHRATFTPHPRHFILVQHYDSDQSQWYPWSWLIRSTDFVRLARGRGAYLFFTTTLNPGRVNRWTPNRIATGEVTRAFLANLHRSSVRRVA